MFSDFAFQYFEHNYKYLFFNMPSALTKMLGLFRIEIDDNKSYLMIMENLNYLLDKRKLTSFDLKGSNINRYITNKATKDNEHIVLLDNNFKEKFNNIPIPLDEKIYELLLLAINNDTLLLSKFDIVDYSLLLNIEEDDNNKKKIRFGIIDYIRKYTWDKQLEHIYKTIINGFNSPTIIKPLNYRTRFIEAIKSYFIGI